MAQLDINKKYRERHKRLGLCVSCSRKAKAGMVQCRGCLAKAREQWRASHPLFCAEGRKLVKSEERWRGNRFHKLCGQKRRARYPQQHRSASLAYRKRHQELGLCLQCPLKAFKGGLCRKHYRVVQERYYERAAG